MNPSRPKEAILAFRLYAVKASDGQQKCAACEAREAVLRAAR